jgi:hypothetical protein
MRTQRPRPRALRPDCRGQATADYLVAGACLLAVGTLGLSALASAHGARFGDVTRYVSTASAASGPGGAGGGAGGSGSADQGSNGGPGSVLASNSEGQTQGQGQQGQQGQAVSGSSGGSSGTPTPTIAPTPFGFTFSSNPLTWMQDRLQQNFDEVARQISEAPPPPPSRPLGERLSEWGRWLWNAPSSFRDHIRRQGEEISRQIGEPPAGNPPPR